MEASSGTAFPVVFYTMRLVSVSEGEEGEEEGKEDKEINSRIPSSCEICDVQCHGLMMHSTVALGSSHNT